MLPNAPAPRTKRLAFPYLSAIRLIVAARAKDNCFLIASSLKNALGEEFSDRLPCCLVDLNRRTLLCAEYLSRRISDVAGNFENSFGLRLVGI